MRKELFHIEGFPQETRSKRFSNVIGLAFPPRVFGGKWEALEEQSTFAYFF